MKMLIIFSSESLLNNVKLLLKMHLLKDRLDPAFHFYRAAREGIVSVNNLCLILSSVLHEAFTSNMWVESNWA